MSRVFVLGNASIDVTLRVPRLPVPGETLMAHSIRRSPGGKGLNQAVMAARCGVQTRFLAPLGTEAEAEIVRSALAAEAGLHSTLVDVGRPSDLSTLLVAPDGENCIVSTGECADGLGVEAALAFVAGMGADDILLMQGNLPLATTLAAARAAPFTILNTAPLRWDFSALLPLCRIVIGNAVEAAAISGASDPAVAARHLAAGGTGIVTLGREGCLVAGETLVRHPAVPVVAVDTTGAGDVFCGVLAGGLALGRELAAAVAAGQRAAAISVGRAGCFEAFPLLGEF